MTESTAETEQHEYPCDDFICKPCHALAHAITGPFDPVVPPPASETTEEA